MQVVRTGSAVAGDIWAKAMLMASGALSGLAAWAVLAGSAVWGGGAAAGAGALLLVGSGEARRSTAPALRFLDAVADRVFDGCILSAVAWSMRPSTPRAAAVALAALSLGFLGAYVRARGGSLGYQTEDGLITRGLRYGLVSLGLLLGAVEATLWAVAVLAGLTAVVRASQVAKEERV